jgi:hypothetical protein
MAMRRALPFALCALLSACDAKEREDLRTQLAAAKSANDATASELTAARQDAAASARRVGELEKSVRDTETRAAAADTRAAAAETRIAAAEKQRGAAVAECEELKKRTSEKLAKELEAVTLHRDELVAWVEDELLPIAEAKDPRLAALRDMTKEIAALVEKGRGLKFRRPFMRRLIRRAQVGEWMLRDLKRDLPEDEARKLTLVGTTFGFVDEKTDLYAVLAQMIEAGAAAFYKCETRTFYLIEGNEGAGARPILFHELVHALEDQYFDLDAFYRAVEDDSDADLARRGLVEGSACHFAAAYERDHPDEKDAMLRAQATPDLIAKQQRMLAEVPPFLVAGIGLYPYANAPAWLAAIHADDAAALEKLYADPPVSTEQVLHPAKFPLVGPRDYPHKVATPDVRAILGEGWENVSDDDLGELQTGVLLTQLRWVKYAPTFGGVLDPATEGLGFKEPIKSAVEGWDGDRYSAWIEKATGRVAIVWVSAWDSDADAKQFAETYGDLLGRRVLGASFASRPSPIRYANAAKGTASAIELSGNRVVAVLEAPPEKLDALVGAGASARVTPDPRDPNDK